MIDVLHVIAAILASWRLTEIIAVDRISAPLRQRFPTYLWTCPRCLSVWAGLICWGFFFAGILTEHWLRWIPLTLNLGLMSGWLYLVQWDYRTRVAGQIDARAHAEVVRRAMDIEERRRRERAGVVPGGPSVLQARGFVVPGNGKR